MTQSLGALFINAALSPVSYAGTCIMQQRVKAGLAELSADNLLGGVARGVALVAKAAGLPDRHVAELLPMARIEALGQRISAHQATAAEQWDVHTGHIGGLLDGVANLTDDGRAPNAPLCLRRLAAKMAMDKALAKPLSELADDLDRWHTLMDTCRAVIDDGEALHRAYRQKRLLRWGVAVAALLGAAAAGVWLTRVQLARSRVDAALAAGDPCSVERISDGDLAKASDAQRARHAERRQACQQAAAEARAAEERARAEAEQREREAREAAEKREREARAAAERAAACQRLAEALAAGNADWGQLAGPHAELLARASQGRLEPADVSADLGELSCDAVAARIGAMLGRAAFAHAGSWMRDHQMSDSIAALIAKGKDELSEKQISIFTASVEGMATDALNMGDEALLTRVVVLCRLTEALGQRPRQMCTAAQKR